LLAGSKYELRPAVRTLQNLIVVFHVLLRDPAGKGPGWDGTGNEEEFDSLRIKQAGTHSPPPDGCCSAVQLSWEKKIA
jgi:hypothetical protein